MSEIVVSVVIITRNRHFIIADCLDALKPQLDFTKHEVIVIDSSEGTETQELMKDRSWVLYHRVSLPLGTRPQSYSLGAQKSKGKIVALLDDDAIVFDNWLSEIEKCYTDTSVGAAGGRVLPREDVPLPPNDLSLPIGLMTSKGRIVSNLYIDSEDNREADVLRGCNMSVRRDLLERINYFDPRLRGQNCRVEDDVCLGVKRLGYKVIFNPKAVVRHLAEERPDIPRSEYNARSEFYVWRNTVWLYSKHFANLLGVFFNVGLIFPSKTCLRRVLGGSFKKPRMTKDGLSYVPAALSGIVGGIWGVLMSTLYLILNNPNQKQGLREVSKVGSNGIHVLGDRWETLQ